MTRIDEQHKVWYAEMRIPMSSIAAWKPDAGRAFRVNFYHVQGRPTRFLAWQPVDQDSFHKPEAFGRLVQAKWSVGLATTGTDCDYSRAEVIAGIAAALFPVSKAVLMLFGRADSRKMQERVLDWLARVR